MLQNQDKRPDQARSAEQKYDEIRNYAPFVCGETWLCPQKVTWRKYVQYILYKLKASCLQVESFFPVPQNEEKVKRTSLCFICSYVKMDVFMPKREKND